MLRQSGRLARSTRGVTAICTRATRCTWQQHSDHPDRCVLIDLALVHAGHWVEDAVYLEHLFWGHEDKLFGIRPVRHMRKLRKERGLAVDSHDSKLADIKRLLIASTAPSFFGVEGDDRYMHRALGLADELLVRVAGS